MKRALEIRKPAQADIADAIRWYEQRDKGLGADFLRALDACLASIERLSVIACLHVRRRPAAWKSRT